MSHVNPSAFDCDLGDWLVVFEQKQSEYFRLSGTAREIWLMLKSGRQRSDIVEDLVERYQINPEECRRSVDAFFQELVSSNLVIEKVPE